MKKRSTYELLISQILPVWTGLMTLTKSLQERSRRVPAQILLTTVKDLKKFKLRQKFLQNKHLYIYHYVSILLSSTDIKAEEEEARERQNSTGCRSGDKGSKEGKEQKEGDCADIKVQ